jgi:phospholipid/cholesterol/gamma-HCH transport system substrate-binding protein
MMRVVRKNVRWVAAILGLAVIAGGVALYILDQQRVRFPWEPAPSKLFVEFDNAQAVTPGQGQSVQVAGVKIGAIAAVELREGRARVELEIEKEHEGLVRRDAKALLRPRTPLKDMYVQILPGTRDGEAAPDGFVIPVQNTKTDVDLDEILESFDERTRDYLTLLIEGTGSGLRGRGRDLAEVFKRFGPTLRDLRRVNQAVGREERSLKRVVTALGDLNGDLAEDPEALTQLVDASAATFTAFASEDDRLRETLSELPPTLRQASTTLRAVRPFARELGPATRSLIPAVRALDRANAEVRPFARAATPVVRDEIRPFTRTIRPLVADLGPAAGALSETLPELTRSGKVLNRFFNMLASNPAGQEGPDKAGREEGFLFWLAWVAHQTVNLQNVEDGNGPMRPIFLTGTCGTLASLVTDNPTAEFGLNLSPLLANVCGNPDTTGPLAEVLDQLPPEVQQLLPPVKKKAGR